MDQQTGNQKDSLFIRVPDGLHLHIEVYGKDRGKPPVVCLPGLTRNGRDFAELATILASAPHDHRVITITSRGRGLSDRDPSPERYTIPVEAADVISVLDQLGIDRAHFIGTSRGGLILHVLAFTHLERMASAILNDIGPVLELDGLRQIQSYLGSRSSPADFEEAAHLLAKTHGSEFPALTEQDWQTMAKAIFREQGGKLLADYDPAIGEQFRSLDLSSPLPDLWAGFEQLAAVPVMTVRGEHSRLLSGATLEEMVKRHPKFDAVMANGQGHAPLLHLDRLDQAIAAFLRR